MLFFLLFFGEFSWHGRWGISQGTGHTGAHAQTLRSNQLCPFLFQPSQQTPSRLPGASDSSQAPFSHSASLSLLGLSSGCLCCSGVPRAALSSSRRAQKGQQGQQEMPGVSPRVWVVPQPIPGAAGALEVSALAGFPSSLTSSVIRAWLSPAITQLSTLPEHGLQQALPLSNIQMNRVPAHKHS